MRQSDLFSSMLVMKRDRPAPPRVSGAQNRRMLSARFDNQFTTEDNRQLWALSDLLSVDAGANYMVRRILRMRSRYAYHNNPFFMGAANRLAKFVIGTGPTLHMSSASASVNRKIETEFGKWAVRVNLARKLRVSRAARFYNGEGFNLLRTNPKVAHRVKLDVFEIEADQVSSPLLGVYPAQFPDQYFDGITLDPWGNKECFQVLRQHPGAFGAFAMMGYVYDSWPAELVLHDYARMRPFQQRGIPECVPALDLFEELRRGRKAVVAAWETAADFAGFVKTQGPPLSDDEVTADTGFGDEMDYVDVRRRKMGVLPEGYDVTQMKAEQPTTTYDMFTMTLLMEIGQVLDMPLFILTGDARLANMSSAYVASQSFMNSVAVDRQEYESLLEQLFDQWIAEASRYPGYLPLESTAASLDHSWRWPRVHAHADPQKMASAQNQRLKNGSSCPSIENAIEGREDFDEMCERAAADYGVPVSEYKAALFQSTFTERGTVAPGAVTPNTGTDGPHDPNDLDNEGDDPED